MLHGFQVICAALVHLESPSETFVLLLLCNACELAASYCVSYRLEEEFHLRLERERQQRESTEAEALRRAARQEKMRKGLELEREAAETGLMIVEDARSVIPVS